jgi:uncharacterized damage-inducible protein DinB
MHRALERILVRDITGLIREIKAYPDDAAVWQTAPGVTNSGGTLALHVAGNMQYFIGAVLNSSGFVRDRDAEFASRGLPRARLLAELKAALSAVEQTLPGLTDTQLAAEYPVPVAGRRVRTSDLLVHLAAHLGYHLGQVDYHRRFVTGHGPLDVVSPRELPEYVPHTV